MSHHFGFDMPATAKNYDESRMAVGVDVIAGLLQVYTGRHLKDLHILDAGCGTGHYAKDLLDLGLGKISLLDASPEMLQIAEKKLKDYITKKSVDITMAKLPDFPFDDSTFDGVMFNQVLHHLDEGGEDFDKSRDFKEVPVLEQVLHNSKRILRPNGLLVISTCLQSNVSENVWFVQLHAGIKEKQTKRYMYLSVDQYMTLFAKHGFKCVSALNLLHRPESTMFPGYWDPEGPMNNKWRTATNMFKIISDEELKEMEEFMIELKRKGTLDQFARDQDHTKERGLSTLFVCILT